MSNKNYLSFFWFSFIVSSIYSFIILMVLSGFSFATKTLFGDLSTILQIFSTPLFLLILQIFFTPFFLSTFLSQIIISKSKKPERVFFYLPLMTLIFSGLIYYVMGLFT